MSLFRFEAIQHTARRLEGRVILAVPPQWHVYTALFSMIIVGATIFLVTGT